MTKNILIQKYIIVLIMIVTLCGCNQNKENESKPNESSLSKNNNNKTYVTKYNDGRISQVRTLDYYNYYKDGVPENSNSKVKLILVVTEWNSFEALVADENSAFTQLPSNTMVGGDDETNKKIEASTKKYFQLSQQYFDTNSNLLSKPDVIPNRDTNYVSFDFITNKGFFTVQEKLSVLENNLSVWSPLFKESKRLNLEIDQVTKNR